MKKTLIALAALGAVAGAQAQSSVTLYGLLDANIGIYTANQATTSFAVAGQGLMQNITQTKVDSGGLNGSRWGMKISEDIGGGNSIIAQLESGFDVSTGASSQGGLLFGRRAVVGMAGGWGTFTMGRNVSSYDDVSADATAMDQTIFDPSQTNDGISLPATVTLNNVASLMGKTTTWLGYSTRFNNSLKYTSPTFSGFSGSLMYALGEDKVVSGAQTIDQSQSWSMYAKWAAAGFAVTGAFQSEEAKGSGTAAAGLQPARQPALQNTLLAASYDFKFMKINGGYNYAQYKDVTLTLPVGTTGIPSGTITQDEWTISASVPMGAWLFSANYSQGDGDQLGKAQGFGAQALYSLSKRTTLYIGGVSTNTYDRLKNAVERISPASDVGNNSTYAMGIRHRF